MCGIVGLLLKNPEMRPRLGQLLVPMLVGMTERGPDSAGLAVFSDTVDPGFRRFNLYADDRAYDWRGLADAVRSDLGVAAAAEPIQNHAILVSDVDPARFHPWLEDQRPEVDVLSVGRYIDIYKDVGTPAEVAERYGFAGMGGTHTVGHTRMATESGVTPAHAHPFVAGEDFCLVHNGSLSNPYSLRRMLEKKGIRFRTDNDTEAACRFIEWRLREGDDLEAALMKCFEELDGFYTFLMGTHDKLALVRDPFACKPAIVAEHDDYVAVASEYRSLAHLPDVKNARLFEPVPEEIYSWKV